MKIFLKILPILLILVFGAMLFSQNISKIPEKNPNLSDNFRENSPENSPPKEQICVKNPKITTFMYHYVRDDDPNDNATTRGNSVTPANFESHMTIIRALADAKKITLMTGDDFIQSFQKNCFPSDNIWNFVADDGWSDNATTLAPLAEKYQIPFTFALIENSLDKKWFMTRNQVIELSKNPLFSIASHSKTHQNHTILSEKMEEIEICESKKNLENLTQKPVTMFIFPLGKIGKNSIKYLQQCDYQIAWSTGFWKNLDWNNLEKFTINRTRISHDTGAKFFENLAQK